MRKPSAHNQGIVADTVTAEALAVGKGARATKVSHGVDSGTLQEAVAALSRAIDELKLPSNQRAVLEEDVTRIHDLLGPKPDPVAAGAHLKSICDKLKMVGTVLGEVNALADPIRRIAEAVQLPLHLLGLG